MRKSVSSAWTFVMKYVFPVAWIALFGASTLMMWIAPDELVFNGVRGAAPPDERWFFLGGWLLGSTFILAIALPLKRVRVVDGSLRISNYLKEIVVPLSQVVRVRQNRWLNIRPITLELRKGTEFGRRITFMPPSRLSFAFWQEDPIVSELRRMAGLSIYPAD